MSYCDMTAETLTWETYWFTRSLQGDVTAIYNLEGTKLVAYSYNAWGEFSTTYYNGGRNTNAVKNSLRYRGYYYDTNLGLYYLQSRYYDARTCRFINADGYVSTGQGLLGYNMFIYCGNNPVVNIDVTGAFWTPFIAAVVAVVTTAIIVGHVATGINKLSANKTVKKINEEMADKTTEEKIDKYLGDNYGSNVFISEESTAQNIKIQNGADVNFRDRMVVSILLSQDGYTSRNAANLAAEWEAHNLVDWVCGGKSERARHIDLDAEFGDNKWYTIAGTIFCHIVGWY